MAIEVKRKPHESLESMLRRFSDRIQQSRVLINAKKRRFYVSPPSKRQRRETAKRRRELQVYREYLRKIGELPEIEPRAGRGRARFGASGRGGRPKKLKIRPIPR